MAFQKPKQGYKLVKSLFGKYEEIPKDWKIKKFYELFKFLSTGTNSRSDLEKSGDIQYIHYGDIHTKWNSILDCDLEEIPWIDKNKVESLPLLKDGDLIIADASEDYAGSGASILLKNVKNKKIVSGLHTIVLRSIDENISSDFKTYLTSIKFVKNQIIAYVTGISVYGLSKKNLKKLKILLPILPEQQKIASILSNVDTLISYYDEIIQRMKVLKKGLMQQLLTKGVDDKKFKLHSYIFNDKITLPENWDFKKCNEICDKLVVGFVGTCDPFYTNDDGIPMLRTGNVGDGKLDLQDLKYVTKEFHKINRKSQVKANDLLVSRHGENGEACLVKGLNEANCLNIVILRGKNELILPEFFEYIFNFKIVRKQIKRTTAGGVQRVVNTKEIAKVKIPLPPKTEQERIVFILTGIDYKITNLDSKKNSLESLKKGLMQKLLTGQIRVKF